MVPAGTGAWPGRDPGPKPSAGRKAKFGGSGSKMTALRVVGLGLSYHPLLSTGLPSGTRFCPGSSSLLWALRCCVLGGCCPHTQARGRGEPLPPLNSTRVLFAHPHLTVTSSEVLGHSLEGRTHICTHTTHHKKETRQVAFTSWALCHGSGGGEVGGGTSR